MTCAECVACAGVAYVEVGGVADRVGATGHQSFTGDACCGGPSRTRTVQAIE